MATPRFTGKSTHSIMSYTAHIECDTEGATIRYTLDGSDPITTTTTSVHDVPPGEPILVHKIGTVTIRAVATKEGMEDSDEAQKTVTIQVWGVMCVTTHDDSAGVFSRVFFYCFLFVFGATVLP